MRMAFLTLAPLSLVAAIALVGTAALADTKPADGKPYQPKSAKVEGTTNPSAEAEANIISAGTLNQATTKQLKVEAGDAAGGTRADTAEGNSF